jgi:hypothetical protein
MKHEMAEACGTTNSYRVLVRKCERKRHFGRTELRWEYNIKISLKKTRHRGVDGIKLVRNKGRDWAVAKTAMNLRFHKMSVISWLENDSGIWN